MNIKQFAGRFRLRITRDQCGDDIIFGKRGHLYFADERLCLMVLDGTPSAQSSWAAVGGKLWLGDISPDPTGKRLQDVKIVDIPFENACLAIKLVKARRVRCLSPEQRVAVTARLPKRPQRPL
jgi:hypothetical protein